MSLLQEGRNVLQGFTDTILEGEPAARSHAPPPPPPPTHTNTHTHTHAYTGTRHTRHHGGGGAAHRTAVQVLPRVSHTWAQWQRGNGQDATRLYAINAGLRFSVNGKLLTNDVSNSFKNIWLRVIKIDNRAGLKDGYVTKAILQN